MATYTLAEAPEVVVSVRGKDSLTTRQKALDKIAEILETEELPTERSLRLSTEQLILTEAVGKTTDAEGGEEQPLEIAVRELHKFLLLKLRTQRLKQAAVLARQNIEVVLTEEAIEQDLDQLEEMVKGSCKSLKEFVGALGEYRQARVGAEAALIIVDEALEFNLSTPTALNSSSSTAQVLTSEPQTDTAKAETTEIEATNETKNGKKRKPEQNGAYDLH